MPSPPRTQNYSSELRNVIWTMWWQGKDNAPDIVKLCWASLKRHCGEHRIIIITKDNYQDYITLPEHILPKVNAGFISLTHLSDVIRFNLLAKYGGWWIDSTMFVADDIPEDIFSLEYFTIKAAVEPNYKLHNIAFLRWTGFCFAAKEANSLLFSFLRDMLHEYWKTHDRVISYVLFDYIILIAFDNFPEFRDAWSKIPINNVGFMGMYKNLSKEWSAELYSELTQTAYLFKTTYKQKFNVRTEEGKETLYGHLLSEYGITPSD